MYFSGNPGSRPSTSTPSAPAQPGQAAAGGKRDLEHESDANSESFSDAWIVDGRPDRCSEVRALEHQRERGREHDTDGKQKHAVDVEIDPGHADLTGEILRQPAAACCCGPNTKVAAAMDMNVSPMVSEHLIEMAAPVKVAVKHPLEHQPEPAPTA